MDFVFVIHNHQPVGNFDFVMEQSFNDCYEPFLERLEKHPEFRIGLHYTGFLWEYILNKHPDLIDRLKRLVKRKQVEIIGGAYYESIVSVLPQRDALSQLTGYKKLMEDFSGSAVNGLWLAERVWEPGLPSVLNQAGYLYTFLDEAHFHAAGVGSSEVWGYFETEDKGKRIKIFPIDKTLRYHIPFEEPEKTIESLAARRDDGVNLITYGDDGEKFGGWPGTKKWVYEDGWMERFFQALKDNPWIKMILPGEAAVEHRPQSDIYLPCASYEEMNEWTLPPSTQIKLRHLEKKLEAAGLQDEVLPLLRGGFWRQYFARYPESGRIYRRLLRVSDKLEKLAQSGSDKLEIARQAFMRGCANDAYWHGVFGGVYLPHLRFAVQKELIIAETICDREMGDRGKTDLYEPGATTLKNNRLRLEIIPRLGGGVASIDVRDTGINIVDTMTRRREAYHARLEEADSSADDSHTSIHDRLQVKEEYLLQKIVFDDHQRLSFLDRILKPNFTLDALCFNRKVECAGLMNKEYEIIEDKTHRKVLKTIGFAEGVKFELLKIFKIASNKAEISVHYELRGNFKRISEYCFAPEIHLNLLAPEADDRYFLLEDEKFAGNNLGSKGEYNNKAKLSLVDDYLGIRIDLEAEPTPRWLWYPVETVSLSEGGVESVYQGSAIYPAWRFGQLGKQSPVIRLKVESCKARI